MVDDARHSHVDSQERMSQGLASRGRFRLAWKLVAAGVTVASLAWVVWLLAGAWPDLATRSEEIRGAELLLGLTLSLGASYLVFEVFASLVRCLGDSPLSRLQLAHLFFTSQLLKHLPGRIWGIGYQWAAGRSTGSLGDWLLINASHMALATFFALWSASLALSFTSGVRGVLFAAVSGGVAYVAAWQLLSSRFGRWLEALTRRSGVLGSGMLAPLTRMSASARLRIFVLFSTSSLLYYASWFAYGTSYPSLGGGGGVQLCALYMLAWFVGYVSLLTPSGLGIRELAFAWLAKDFPADAVALMAVIGRASLLSVDVILGLLFAPFVPRKS